MAEEKKGNGGKNASGQRIVPKRPPGILCGVEFYKQGRVKLTSEQQTAVRDVFKKLKLRDQAARREQLIFLWKKHWYSRGMQHILSRRGGGWELPAPGTGYNPNDEESKSRFTCNIYQPFEQMITSVLTREIPKTQMEPDDPDDDVDITTAEGAEKLEKRIDRDNDLKTKMEKMARFLYLDSYCVAMQTYELDGQRWGYEKPEEEQELEDETVPEDEEAIGEQERASGDGMPEAESGDEEAPSANGERGGETSSDDEAGSSDEDQEPEGAEGSDQDPDEDELGSDEEPEPLGEAKGHECIHIGGGLQWKLPIKAESRAECSYAISEDEIPINIAKGKYPWIADQITPSQGGPGGDDIDRLARVNVKLGVIENYNTTDTQTQDVTEAKAFIRPAELIAIENDEIRDQILRLFPRGMYVTFVGQTFAEAYNASMDDHLSIVWAFAGDGVNRPAIGDWLVPVQEVLNNWLELSNDYFIRGVPQTWMDEELFNLDALKDQDNTPGAIHGFTREPGVQMAEAIWREAPLEFPPELKTYIDDFKGDLAQKLTGAVPALTGEGEASATDTFGGMLVQRDAALGRVGLPWRAIKEFMASVKRQAIQMLARNHRTSVTTVGESVKVQLEQMNGNFHVFADTDENIPASFTEVSNALTKIFNDAVTNPTLGELIFNPDNLETFRDYSLKKLQFPQIQSRDKQLGELVLLLKGEPLPNPAIQQGEIQIAELQKQIQDLEAGAQIAAQQGAATDPTQIAAQLQQLQSQVQQIQQQIQALPPKVSSVPVRKFDDDDSELYVVVKWLNSPQGREFANGDDEEMAAYANAELHATEHETAGAQKKSAKAQAAKPPSTSINIKDLPPALAAQLAQQANLRGSTQDFAEEAAAAAAAKHPGPGGVTVGAGAA